MFSWLHSAAALLDGAKSSTLELSMLLFADILARSVRRLPRIDHICVRLVSVNTQPRHTTELALELKVCTRVMSTQRINTLAQ